MSLIFIGFGICEITHLVKDCNPKKDKNKENSVLDK
jgi:hypothetical protein